MNAIDLHVHLGDIFCGHDIAQHKNFGSKLGHFLPRLNEYLGFELMHHPWLRNLEDPKSSWQFSKDCVGISDAAHLSKSLDQSGINYGCVLAVEPYVQTEWVIRQKQSEQRIIPFLSVHPDDLQMREKVKDYVKKGCKGVKLHPVIQNFSPASKNVFQLIETIAEYDLPVMCHTGCFSIPHLMKRGIHGQIENYMALIKAFPKVPFIIAHMNLLRSDKAIEAARQFENIYLETSWQTAGNIQKALAAVGSERVVFGSDWPYAYQHTSLAVVKRACANEREFENVSWKNAQRLIKL